MAQAARMQLNALFRTLSGGGKEISHAHPSHSPLRPTASLDIGEGRKEEQIQHCTSLPVAHSLDSAGSLSESLHSSSPTSSSMEGAESPTAAQQQHQEQRRQAQRRPYKVHGMDPYDYWSLIKSL